jgi:hypothetical protein
MIPIHGIPASFQNEHRRRMRPKRFVAQVDRKRIVAAYRRLRVAGFEAHEARQLVTDLLQVGKFMKYEHELSETSVALPDRYKNAF